MVSNYTDVDDKIINVAKELGVSEKEVTDKFIKAYNDDRLSLHAMMPDEAPRVTETMDAIIAFIDLLVQKGYAYQVGGDVYFRVGEVKEYGALSHQKTEDLVSAPASTKMNERRTRWISRCGNRRMKASNGIRRGRRDARDGIPNVS